MKYNSTRNSSNIQTSMEVIKQGISPEGGLFVPMDFPVLLKDDLNKMITMSYAQRAEKILGMFLTDFSEQDIAKCVRSAYESGRFDSQDVAPVVKLNEGLSILELWHGPTCAFKDMALQILPHFMTTVLNRTCENKEIVILVATSGDTGKAALEGFMNVDNTHVVVFFPQEGISDMQRLQMLTQEGNNVYVAAVEGNFDDTQSGVKAIFTNPDIINKIDKKGYRFSSANSINWGRLVPQIVYYISAYLDMMKQNILSDSERFNIVVPTGNFGNILAAYYAGKMGIPIHKLICASNVNNILTDFCNTGVYDIKRRFYKTISPSMDILISSNLERFLYELAELDDKQVNSWMKDLSKKGSFQIEDEALNKLRAFFWGGYATDEQTRQAIQSTYDQFNYVLDPHTAVGKWVYDRYVEETGDTTKTLIVSTASPFKFSKDVLEAIAGKDSVSEKDEFQLLDTLSDIMNVDIPKPLVSLKDKEVRHNIHCTPKQMEEIVSKIFLFNEVLP